MLSFIKVNTDVLKCRHNSEPVLNIFCEFAPSLNQLPENRVKLLLIPRLQILGVVRLPGLKIVGFWQNCTR